MAAQRFSTVVKAEGNSAYIDLDFDVPGAFGTKGRVSVAGTINGHEFVTSISPRHGRCYLIVNREMRARMGVDPGDRVEVVIDRDNTPRTIEAPDDLQAAIDADDAARTRWASMSFSHRKQYVTWIEEAKRPETRTRRIEQAVPMIAEAQRRS